MTTKMKSYLSRPFLLLPALIICAALLFGFTMQPRTLTVVADGKYHTIVTNSRSARSVVADAGITLGQHDRLETSRDDLSEGTVIRVNRAVPVVISLNNRAKEVYTTAATVGEAVVENGYRAEQYVTLIPAETPIKAQMNIPIGRYDIKRITVDEVVPHQVMIQPNGKMMAGEENILTEGVDGARRVTYDLFIVNGVTAEKHEVGAVRLKTPVNAVKEVGTRTTVETSRGALRFTKKMSMEATAYHPMDGDGRGITYSGIPARYGVVAVDPNVIPIGTRVYVPGYGEAIAADTGGAIKGARIDLCMETYSECYNFGRRMVEVYVLQ